MKLAYLIMVHKNLDQFKRLFMAIYVETNTYIIHVDKKSDIDFYTEIEAFVGKFKNTHMMKRFNCRWGGYSMVQIELDAMKIALDIDLAWQYFINLSGQCFPLTSQNKIMEFLSTAGESNFIDIFDPLNNGRWRDPLYRVTDIHIEFRDRVFHTPLKRKFMKDTHWYAGSQWFMVTREFCKYAVSGETRKFRNFFRFAHIPDESFFQTVIMNSNFREKVINDNKRIIEWGNKAVKIWTYDDYQYLLDEGAFFARKFDITKDNRIIDKLEAHLLSYSFND